MARDKENFSPAALVDFMERSFLAALDTGLILRTAGAEDYHGDRVMVGHASMCNFAGCSYLGLEQRAELREAAIEAIQRYGTQLSISRAYLESPYYPQLEEALELMTGGKVMVAASTTAAHISALPVLMGERDAVLVDKFAHASLHTALALVQGVPVQTLPHGRLDVLEERVSALEKTHDHVWYVLDGLYSMSGEFAPFDQLAGFLAQHPQLHLYIDDAHATSWCGKYGRGRALDVLPDTSRVVVALSLNKAFSAAGGAVVFPNDRWRQRVRWCGGPMVFSGPIQPPMLAAAVASARLHLEPWFAELQRELRERILLLHRLAAARDVEIATKSTSPIVNVRCGTAPAAFALTRHLWDRGFFVSPAAPPAVPPDHSGIRMTVSLHNSRVDIERLVGALADGLESVRKLN